MPTPSASRWPLALVAAALGAATLVVAARLPAPRERPYDISVVPAPATARWLSLGHPTLAANLFWLRAVQYVGEPRAAERGWERLFPAVDLITELDPRHGYAYQVAGTVLGNVGRIDEANALLEKGFQKLPARYTLALLRAFNAFYYQDDWVTAGRFAEAAARAPGAPAHVRQNALAYYVKGKRADAAVAFLEAVRTEARDEESKKAIDAQLRQARLEAVAAPIDDALESHRRDRLLGPLYLEQLVERGYLPALPADPLGGRWVVGEDGRVRSSLHGHRLRSAPDRRELRPEPAVASPQPGGTR